MDFEGEIMNIVIIVNIIASLGIMLGRFVL